MRVLANKGNLSKGAVAEGRLRHASYDEDGTVEISFQMIYCEHSIL
jgi:hypothetical protein